MNPRNSSHRSKGSQDLEPGFESVPPKTHHRRSSTPTKGTAEVNARFILVCLGALVGIVVLILVVIRIGMEMNKQGFKPISAQNANETDPSAKTFRVDDFEEGNADEWKGPLPEEVASKFAKAETTEERLKWVRNPEGVAEALRAFFESGPGATERVTSVAEKGPMQTETVTFERFVARLQDGGERLVCVVLNNNEGKVDFDSYARRGSAPWSELLSGAVEGAEEMRVSAEPGKYYNFGFADEKNWRHFRADTPDLEVSLDLYAALGSETAKKMEEAVAEGEGSVTLSIRAVDDSHKRRQFEITKVLTAGWVR